MATASVTNTFVASTPAVASEVNTNFTNLVTFLNNSTVHVDGSKAMTGNFDAGSNKIVNLTNGTASKDAVNYGQLTNSTSPLPLGMLDYDTRTTLASMTSSSYTDIGVSVSFTGVAGRLYKVQYHVPRLLSSGGGLVIIRLVRGTSSVVQLQSSFVDGADLTEAHIDGVYVGQHTGAMTMKLQCAVASGVTELTGAATYPITLSVEDVGLA